MHAGVDTSQVLVTDGEATGVALIPVEAGGQDLIVVAGGADLRLTPSDVETALSASRDGLLLAQLESPAETVEAAIACGRSRGDEDHPRPCSARPLSRRCSASWTSSHQYRCGSPALANAASISVIDARYRTLSDPSDSNPR